MSSPLWPRLRVALLFTVIGPLVGLLPWLLAMTLTVTLRGSVADWLGYALDLLWFAYGMGGLPALVCGLVVAWTVKPAPAPVLGWLLLGSVLGVLARLAWSFDPDDVLLSGLAVVGGILLVCSWLASGACWWLVVRLGWRPA